MTAQPALNPSGVLTEDQPGAVVERVGTGSLQCYAEVAVAPFDGRWYSSLSVQASHTGWSSPMVPRYAEGFEDVASAKVDAVARVAKWLRGNMKSPDNGVRVAARKLLDLMAGKWPDEIQQGGEQATRLTTPQQVQHVLPKQAEQGQMELFA